MTTNATTGSEQRSATIYQFPARGRYAEARGIQPELRADRAAPQMTMPTVASAWYHDEAIRKDLAHND